MVLVDSSVWIEALRRDGRLDVKVALESLLEEYEAAWCGPVKLEVLGGARPQERQKLESHFECIPYFQMKDSAWDTAKKMAWQLRDRGCNPPWNDILIATLSRLAECRVYSIDQQFQQMYEAGAGIILYEAGYGGAYNPN
ncbi:MAG TPA: PIN domain-containing protein [Verrucomicrobiae bacterium]|nr:PIN domain-containing protein [Verrucomicrobiae bacterium]